MSALPRLLLFLTCIPLAAVRAAPPVDATALLNLVRGDGEIAARARALQQLAIAGPGEAVPVAESLGARSVPAGARQREAGA